MPRTKRPLQFCLAACAALTCTISMPAREITCATCHRAEAQSQPRNAMGRATELPADQDILKAHPKLTFQKDGYIYSVERKGGHSVYTVRDGTGELSLPIEYAMGVHNQTFVLQYQGHFYESQVSYFERLQGLEITLGDEKRTPHNLVEAMGRETPNKEITECFACHATNAVHQRKLTLDSLQPGSLASIATRAPARICKPSRRARRRRCPQTSTCWERKTCRTSADNVIARGRPLSGCGSGAMLMSALRLTGWRTVSASWATTGGSGAWLATTRMKVSRATRPPMTTLAWRVIDRRRRNPALSPTTAA